MSTKNYDNFFEKKEKIVVQVSSFILFVSRGRYRTCGDRHFCIWKSFLVSIFSLIFAKKNPSSWPVTPDAHDDSWNMFLSEVLQVRDVFYFLRFFYCFCSVCRAQENELACCFERQDFLLPKSKSFESQPRSMTLSFSHLRKLHTAVEIHFCSLRCFLKVQILHCALHRRYLLWFR